MPRIAPITCAVLLTLAPFGLSAVHAADTPSDSTIAEVTDSTYVYDLVNEPSECINSNPRPDCGKKPQGSGDRGGWMQYTVFLVMIAGVGIVGSVLIRNVIRRDRAIAEKMSQDE
ncbi:MAG: hypothetical protein EXQ61_05985 [Ilumatobacteraceae bacterium]|nr:hypothetical protein [Ilumatobacteraceae bacterium]